MLKKYSLHLAWIIALIGFFTTLYFGYILNWPVCDLCWYQRICLYPLVIILGIACFRDDHKIGIYTIPLAVIGALLSLYQYLEQMIPSFAPINVCGLGGDCSTIHLQWLGFITVPFLGLLGFVVIIILLLLSLLCSRKY